MSGAGASGPSPAVGQALDVLRLLGSRPEPMPAAAIARDLGLPRSSTYKLLTALMERGFVTHLPEERRYGLGVAAFEVGSAYSRQGAVARLGRALLARLAEQSTHNAHLGVLHGADVLYVVEERAPRRPVLVTEVGVRLPAHLTATGLALLAASPPAQVRALYPATGAFVTRRSGGPTTLRELRAELAATRRRGYALEVETVTPGLASVASAACEVGGHPVAALAVTYPVGPGGPGPGEVDRLAALTRAAAEELTRRLRGSR